MILTQLTLPSLAWQACLKVSNVQLDLITNSEMLLMIEEAVRGGITQVITKSSVANNKYMQNYYQNEDSSFLRYLDFPNNY